MNKTRKVQYRVWAVASLSKICRRIKYTDGEGKVYAKFLTFNSYPDLQKEDRFERPYTITITPDHRPEPKRRKPMRSHA